MHLKKLLGRRRTRFVLLASPDEISESVVKLYHDCIDISLDEQPLLEAIASVIDAAASKRKKTGVSTEGAETATALPPADDVASAAPAEIVEQPVTESVVEKLPLEQPFQKSQPVVPPEEAKVEPSLEEQGVVYAPKPPQPVYSEFTSAFESAVSEISAEEPAPVSRLEQTATQAGPRTEHVPVSPQPRSKRTTFMFWLVPLTLIVVTVTLLQNYLSKPRPVAGVSVSPSKPDEKLANSTAIKTETAKKPDFTATAPAKVAEPVRAAEKSAQKVVPPVTANQRGGVQAPSSVQRPIALPAFIPRDGLDKAYGVANPGWERYTGVATEFKVFRDGKTIKAIQAIDRGGKGLPEAFMRGALGQLAGTQSIVPASSEKKEEYLVQRAQLAGNLSAVFYRDAKGGKLRGFVVTWQ